MLKPLADSSLKTDQTEGQNIRLLGETANRRLWIGSWSLTRSMADLCLAGGALGGTVLIASSDRRRIGQVSDVIGRS